MSEEKTKSQFWPIAAGITITVLVVIIVVMLLGIAYDAGFTRGLQQGKEKILRDRLKGCVGDLVGYQIIRKEEKVVKGEDGKYKCFSADILEACCGSGIILRDVPISKYVFDKYPVGTFFSSFDFSYTPPSQGKVVE